MTETTGQFIFRRISFPFPKSRTLIFIRIVVVGVAMAAQIAILYGVKKYFNLDGLDEEKRLAKVQSNKIFKRLGVFLSLEKSSGTNSVDSRFGLE